MRDVRMLLVVCGLASWCEAQTAEARTARYLESVRQRRPLLVEFLRRMPKGGDLHLHLTGAVYAESYITWAAEAGLCVDRASSGLRRGPCGTCERSEPRPPASCALKEQALYDQLVDAWSMRGFRPATESGHDRFFGTFGKFSPAIDGRVGDALAEVASRAAAERVSYLEAIVSFAGDGFAELVGRAGWDDDLLRQRERLLSAGLRDAVAAARAQLDADEARRARLLGCAGARPDPGCRVSTRYLSQVHRGHPREAVFAQILLSFELARADPRIVGFNLVMPEDGGVAMREFDLHMRMIETLRPSYPGVRVALHAGELIAGLVPPEGLRFHVRQSVERAGAERIGHGVSVMHEDDARGLLRELARRRVLVEVCLSSNDLILGVSGSRHPLAVYLASGVPVALATDDAGVARSDLTHELVRAVEDHGVGYRELKRMARSSLSHSFLPGASLWSENAGVRQRACRADDPAREERSPACAAFLGASERARLQWSLEKDLSAFERSVGGAP